jgi:hypothetical protein
MGRMGEIGANQLAREMAMESIQTIREDKVWRLFGFKKAPKRGSYFNRFVNKEKLMLERFFRKELFILSYSAGVLSLPEYCDAGFKVKFLSRGIKMITEEMPEIAPAFGYDTGKKLSSYFHKGVTEYYKVGKMDSGHFLTTFSKRGADELGNNFKSEWTSVVAAMCLHPDSPIMDMMNTTEYILENKRLIDDL